jgi:signal transduction histidine kinase
VGHQGLEYQSLLPSVLLGDVDGERPHRSTRDWLVDVTAFLLALSLGAGLFIDSLRFDPAPALVALDVVCGIVGVTALWWRRRWPVGVAVLLVVLACVSALAAVASIVALFSVAVHRPFRVVALVAALGVVTLPVFQWLRPNDEPFVVEAAFGVLLTGVALAWGMFVRARRQLVLSLHERARRAEAEQGLRVEQARRMERDRIAREMHDVLAHRISLVSLHAGALEYAAGGASPEEVVRAAGVIRSAAHQALEDLREVIGVLREDEGAGVVERPQPTLDDLGSLLEESRAAGMKIRSYGPLPVAVPASIGRSAYRIVQEGLTNARKHAPGCAVDVAVTGRPGDGLAVEVRNPLPVGVGAAVIPGAGTGIVGLGERVALSGGEIEHGPAGGEWRLRAWLPWPAQ